MVIVTGTGRSGTGTLAGLLRGHHEFRAAYILGKYFAKADPHSDPFDTIEKGVSVVLDLHQGIDKETFVDSSNLYIHFIDAVFALNPSVKFILVIRNGKDFVRSAHNRRWHDAGVFGTVPPYADPYFEKWREMSPLQRNAWIWVYRNEKALRGLCSVPAGQKMVVKIEDIDRKETLDSLAKFTVVRIDGEAGAIRRCNANPVFDLPPRGEWTDGMNREFEEIAGGMMRFFGYS